MKNVHTRYKVSRFLLSIMIVSVLASSAVIASLALTSQANSTLTFTNHNSYVNQSDPTKNFGTTSGSG